uniref:ATP-dependent RNA helicase n=1 Tax=Cercocebus atys TaxID=9531 RepID=A0A2K5LZZ3_CERAT
MSHLRMKLLGASNLTLSETQNGDVSEETMEGGKVKKIKTFCESQDGAVSQETVENVQVQKSPQKSTVLTNGETAMQSPNSESKKKKKKKKRKMVNDAKTENKGESKEESVETAKETENNVEKPDNEEDDSEVPSLPLGLTGAFEDTSFASLSNLVNENTLKAIKEMDFTNMTEIQHKSIRLEGRDLLAAAKTGSVELIVKLKFMPTNKMGVLILSPTRELAMQTFGVCKELMTHHVHTSGLITSGGNRSAEAQKLANGINIIVCLVIDEADQILDAGFEEELKQIIKLLPTRRQAMLFSATQTQNVEDLPLYVGVDDDKANAIVDDLEQGYGVCPSEKRFLLPFTVLKKNRKKAVMVFFSSCMSVKHHYELLNYKDLLTLAIHGKQNQNKCTTTFFQFCNADSGTLYCVRMWQQEDWTFLKLTGLFKEMGFLHYLKQSKVPLSEFDFSQSKISDIQSQLEKLIEKNYFLRKSAQEAYKSYTRAYNFHSLKQIFNVSNLNLPQVALSFGFEVLPFVDLKINSNEGKQKNKKSSDSRQLSH